MPTILIVDDDAAMRDGLAETVADLEYRALVAANGADALAGSSPTRLRMKGKAAPAIVPNMTTPTRLNAIVSANTK